MSIAKADILTAVNANLNRSETDIDREIKAILVDLSIHIPEFHLSATASTIAGQGGYTLRNFPEDVRAVDAVRIIGGLNEEPLNRIASWEDYLHMIADETSSDRDEPDAFIVYSDILYLYPTPDVATYTIEVFASKIENDVDDIDIPDSFQPALEDGATWEKAKNLQLGNESENQIFKAEYIEKRKSLISFGLKKKTKGRVIYNDL